jgi:hypothetical protein
VNEALETQLALEVLDCGEVEVLGLIPYSSNYTFLAQVRGSGQEVKAVYKPRRGERPLWDFPEGTLAEREVAAFILSRVAGWDLVPPTVIRTDAPIGPGSLQLFIEHDPERHFFVLQEERFEDFKTFALFDALINNADRKAGHVLEDASGRLWAVDHGVTFNEQSKLRTVIWDFAGRDIPDNLQADLARLGSAPVLEQLIEELSVLLDIAEVEATVERIEDLSGSQRFPLPLGDRDLPWPLI